MRRYLIFLILLATITAARGTPAHATEIVNDAANPFPPSQVAQLRHWLRRSATPTPVTIVVHAGACPLSVACANVDRCDAGPQAQWCEVPGSIWIDPKTARDRFAFMHEVGHVMDLERGTAATRTRLEQLLHTHGAWRPDARSPADSTPPFELAADAYAMCSIHRRWPGSWWRRVTRRPDGTTLVIQELTPLDFRAGRERYTRICATLRL